MRVLSIDPGITTGIAICSEYGVEVSITVVRDKLLSRGFLNKLVAMAEPEIVLVEGVPSQSPNQQQLELKIELVRWFSVAGYPVEEIQPSRWKGLVARVEIPGQHARDAATMARWWLEQEGQLKERG